MRVWLLRGISLLYYGTNLTVNVFLVGDSGWFSKLWFHLEVGTCGGMYHTTE